jgi:hypothetical protein
MKQTVGVMIRLSAEPLSLRSDPWNSSVWKRRDGRGNLVPPSWRGEVRDLISVKLWCDSFKCMSLNQLSLLTGTYLKKRPKCTVCCTRTNVPWELIVHSSAWRKDRSTVVESTSWCLCWWVDLRRRASFSELVRLTRNSLSPFDCVCGGLTGSTVSSGLFHSLLSVIGATVCLMVSSESIRPQHRTRREAPRFLTMWLSSVK